MSSSSQPTILEHRDRLNNDEREQREKRQQGEQHELGRLNELEQKGDGSNKKILVVLTSQINLGNTGKETGWYLPELAHPYFVLAPYHSLVFASPEGGVAPCDQKSAEEFKDDEECIKLLRDGKVKYALEHTKKLSDVKASEFDAIIFVGGHGPMFDLPNNKSSQKLIIDMWEQGGVVAAVCHGSCALVNVKLSDGSRFVEGKNIACFTDKEEEEVGLSDVVPFLLESELKKAGARIQTADKWQSKVVTDGRLITGQNPASARDWARQIHETLVSSPSSSSRQQNATVKPVEQQQQQKLQDQESRGGSNEKLQQQPLQGERLPHVALQHHQKTQ